MSLMGGWTQALQKRQAEEKRRGHYLLCEGICEGVVWVCETLLWNKQQTGWGLVNQGQRRDHWRLHCSGSGHNWEWQDSHSHSCSSNLEIPSGFKIQFLLFFIGGNLKNIYKNQYFETSITFPSLILEVRQDYNLWYSKISFVVWWTASQ